MVAKMPLLVAGVGEQRVVGGPFGLALQHDGMDIHQKENKTLFY